MQANQKTVAELLSGASRYIIPVFQRYYCWAAPNWEQLWTDLLGLVDAPTKQHFLGALVTVAHEPEPGAPAPFHVIDGQQRLTTLSILLCAIRDAARDRDWS